MVEWLGHLGPKANLGRVYLPRLATCNVGTLRGIGPRRSVPRGSPRRSPPAVALGLDREPSTYQVARGAQIEGATARHVARQAAAAKGVVVADVVVLI